jgi:hypothetical protein
MAVFNICKIAINDFHYLFDDLALSVAASLRDLGHECSMTVNEMSSDAINILIGSIIFDELLISGTLSCPYIVYQMEILDDQLGHLKNYPNYLNFLSRAQSVWEYSPKNVAYLKSRGLGNVMYVPPGYHPICEKVAWRNSPHQFDFLFIGSLSQGRITLLEGLIKRGYKVGAITDANKAFGAQRDQAIADSKIVLNIHCFENLNNLETVRISYLLANEAIVISEASDHDPYHGAIGYANYGVLADYCISVLADTLNLEERSKKGYLAIKSIDMPTFISRALQEIGISSQKYNN